MMLHGVFLNSQNMEKVCFSVVFCVAKLLVNVGPYTDQVFFQRLCIF